MRLAFGDKAKLGYAILVLLLAGGLGPVYSATDRGGGRADRARARRRA